VSTPLVIFVATAPRDLQEQTAVSILTNANPTLASVEDAVKTASTPSLVTVRRIDMELHVKVSRNVVLSLLTLLGFSKRLLGCCSNTLLLCRKSYFSRNSFLVETALNYYCAVRNHCFHHRYLIYTR
jgi:hypothetical protein